MRGSTSHSFTHGPPGGPTAAAGSHQYRRLGLAGLAGGATTDLLCLRTDRLRPNLQSDILPAVTFVTIAAASLSAQRPLPAVVVRFVRALRTTCSRGSGPPVDQRSQVFTSNQAWTAGICPKQEHDSRHQQANSRPDRLKA